MIQFIDLWRAHPFNDGGRCDWLSSAAAQYSTRAITTALVRTGVAEGDVARGETAIPEYQGETGAHILASRLDAARDHGFGKRETFNPACENDVFRAIVGRTGVVLNVGHEPRIDVWNGQRSATMGLARWVQLLTARPGDAPNAPEMWFWPLPDNCGGPD